MQMRSIYSIEGRRQARERVDKKELAERDDNDKDDWLIVLRKMPGLMLSAASWIEETDI